MSWIDRLAQAGQSWWQMLPLGPTGYGNSPYQSVVLFRRERTAHQSGLADRGWTVAGKRLSAPLVPARQSRLRRRDPFQTRGCLKRPGPTSAPALAPTCGRPMSNSAMTRRTGWRITRCSGRSKSSSTARITSNGRQSWSQREPAALDQARRELADQIDQVCFAQFLLFRQGERLKAHAHAKGVKLDRRPALFCFSRLERRVGQPGVVSAGRTAPAALRRRRASRLLQRAGTALGQSRLQLGRSSPDRLSLVDFTVCALCWPTST